MRDSATLWILERSGRFALPRVAFDSIGETWERPWVQLNYVQQDGQTLRVWSQEPGNIELNGQGLPAVRRAGGLRFECIEPFRRWTLDFDGRTVRSSTAQEMAGPESTAPSHLTFHVEAEMVAPPWLMGGMTAEAARQMARGDAGALMGGVRYEQLCTVTGWIEVEGKRQPIEGTGMRVRRQGVRHMGSAMGHCQHSAVWPSGRAFGAIVMAPGPEGPVVFNEAFVITPDGRKLAATVSEAPWMRQLIEQDDASLLLSTSEGDVRIMGETLLSMFDHHKFEMADTSVLHQGTARYSWDGEETIGLIERCTLREKLT
ncbi:hypothetical protein [Novosphingobium sp. M1R2S20]|uniref:Lipocalin-like protein n=1 Tax=Novosphingobium rhizovicinum TaxID=3228928 RepID=A0ABV3REP6_9SPHN